MTLESLDIQQQKLKELQNIFPEIFEDANIDLEKLKNILGESVDDSSEHYSFSWSGKRECYKTIKAKTNATLKVDTDASMMSMFHENILTQGAKELDIVYEIGLKNGFTLSAKVDEVKTDNYSFITLSEEERTFYFSFDKKIETDIVHSVPNGVKLICYEKTLSTNVKLNLRESLDLEVL